MKQIIKLNVNGLDYEIAAEPNETLVDVLREDLLLTGVKKGCDDGDCGACTVLVDGKAVPSCCMLAIDMQGKKIITIEGLEKNGVLNPVQQAFIDQFAVECGFCTPGMILTSVALLNENPDPTEDEIRDALRGNLCRCTGYAKIINAVMAAKEMLKEQRKAS